MRLLYVDWVVQDYGERSIGVVFMSFIFLRLFVGLALVQAEPVIGTPVELARIQVIRCC
jgi:hypothetical protein